MNSKRIVLFGESEKGLPHVFTPVDTLPALVDIFGHPSKTGLGIHMAVQAMLYKQDILFYKIAEEGFLQEEYLIGFKLLKESRYRDTLQAIALPGVGDPEILFQGESVCKVHKIPILVTEKDLYDFVTSY